MGHLFIDSESLTNSQSCGELLSFASFKIVAVLLCGLYLLAAVEVPEYRQLR